MMQDFHGPCKLNFCFLGRLFNRNSSKNTVLLLTPDMKKQKACYPFVQNFCSYTEPLGLHSKKTVMLFFFCGYLFSFSSERLDKQTAHLHPHLLEHLICRLSEQVVIFQHPVDLFSKSFEEREMQAWSN